MMYTRKSTRIFIIIYIIALIFISNLKLVTCANFEIILTDEKIDPEDNESENHQSVYNFWGCLELGYKKYVVQEIIENSTNIEVKMHEFLGENATDFDIVPNDNVSYILTGNISKDISSDITYVSGIIPLGIDFRVDQPDLMPFLVNMVGADEKDLRFSFFPSETGYSFKVNFYYKIVVWVQMMSLNIYFSTTGVLLQARYEYYDPDNNFQKCNGGIDIMPEHSSFPGANEDPMDPAGMFLANGDEKDPLKDLEGDEKILWDTSSIIIVTSGFITLIAVSAYFIKRKKKISSIIV